MSTVAEVKDLYEDILKSLDVNIVKIIISYIRIVIIDSDSDYRLMTMTTMTYKYILNNLYFFTNEVCQLLA